MPYDFDGCEAENGEVDIIEPAKKDLEKNRPKDVKKQKQDEDPYHSLSIYKDRRGLI